MISARTLTLFVGSLVKVVDDPPARISYITVEVLHLFRCVTHTPCRGRASFWKSPKVFSNNSICSTKRQALQTPAKPKIISEVLHLYRCVTHTHTLPKQGFVLFEQIGCSLMHELLYTFDTVTWQGFTQYIKKLTMKPLEELGSHHGSSCFRPFTISQQTPQMPGLPSMNRRVGPRELKL